MAKRFKEATQNSFFLIIGKPWLDLERGIKRTDDNEFFKNSSVGPSIGGPNSTCPVENSRSALVWKRGSSYKTESWKRFQLIPVDNKKRS